MRFVLLVLTLMSDRRDRHGRDVPHALPAAELGAEVEPTTRRACPAHRPLDGARRLARPVLSSPALALDLEVDLGTEHRDLSWGA